MALEKKQQFGVTLPPDLEKVEEDVKKRMESKIADPITVDDPAAAKQKKIN